jgi:hypothetical protein
MTAAFLVLHIKIGRVVARKTKTEILALPK